MTPQLNQTAKDLLDRIDSDCKEMEEERAAREKVAPLVKQIREAGYHFLQQGIGPPTRLHVSEEIFDQLWDSVNPHGREVLSIRGLLFMGYPVKIIPDLHGFRWVRERNED